MCRADLVHRLVQLLSEDLIVHLDLRGNKQLIGGIQQLPTFVLVGKYRVNLLFISLDWERKQDCAPYTCPETSDQHHL